MRKVYLTLALAVALTFSSNLAFSQSDGFFNGWNDFDNQDIIDGGLEMPGLPGSHGFEGDQSGEAPLGTGLLVLTALGVGYAVAKRKKVES